jgi:hypothetical protein
VEHDLPDVDDGRRDGHPRQAGTQPHSGHIQSPQRGVRGQLAGRSPTSLGLRAVSCMVRRPWLAQLLPSSAALLRARLFGTSSWKTGCSNERLLWSAFVRVRDDTRPMGVR